jgi:hypothetical protein
VLFALLVAVSSVMLGAALSFAPASRGLLGYMRTFATLAAVAVVVTHLLPEALHELGPLSILLFLVGWFAPALAHSVGQRSTSGRSAHAVLEAGYWGLIVHHVADGIGLGTYTRLPSADGSHLDVIVALAAHTVPLIAVVSLAYRTTFGARSALLRSLGLALASIFGIALSSLVAAETIARFAPTIAAIAAGLLLHVVTHDLTQDAPHSALGRTLDFVIAGLGVGVSLLGIDRHSEPATWAFANHLVGLTERSALVILVGLAVAALSLRLSDRAPVFARATLPAAALGSDSLLLGIALFGFGATAARVVVTAVVVALLGAPPESEGERCAQGWVARSTEALSRSGPWLVLGLVVGALLSAVPPSVLSHRLAGSISELALLALVANATPAAAPAALLIATGLGALGLSAGGTLLFATLAPLLAGRTLAWSRRLSISVSCCGVAWLTNSLGVASAPLEGAFSASEPGQRLALALAVLLLFGIWQRGARVWLSTIVKTPAHEHEHAHDVHGPHEH